MLRTTLLTLSLLSPRIAHATYHRVALDVKPVGKVDADLATSLTPMAIELGRFDSVSVVTQLN